MHGTVDGATTEEKQYNPITKKALKEKERLTVITNSMEILLELADVSGWNIISTGGVMKEGYLAFQEAACPKVLLFSDHRSSL